MLGCAKETIYRLAQGQPDPGLPFGREKALEPRVDPQLHRELQGRRPAATGAAAQRKAQAGPTAQTKT